MTAARVLVMLLGVAACDREATGEFVAVAAPEPVPAVRRAAPVPLPALPDVVPVADLAEDEDIADPDPDAIDGNGDLDRDDDHLVNDLDRCPDEPEDFDGFSDDDGCPDPDVDVDSVLDVDDRCPNLPAGSEFEDLDSCLG